MTLTLRMTQAERDLLDELVRERNEALVTQGASVTATSVVVALIREAAAKRGRRGK